MARWVHPHEAMELAADQMTEHSTERPEVLAVYEAASRLQVAMITHPGGRSAPRLPIPASMDREPSDA